MTRRALDEIPYHLSRLDFSETQVRWIQIWSDPGWLLTKLATSGVTQVMEDFALTPESCRPEHFKQWMTLLAPAIDYDYRQVASQLIGRGAPQTGIFEKLCRNPLVACLLPSHDLAPSDCSEKDICISAGVCVYCKNVKMTEYFKGSVSRILRWVLLYVYQSKGLFKAYPRFA